MHNIFVFYLKSSLVPSVYRQYSLEMLLQCLTSKGKYTGIFKPLVYATFKVMLLKLVILPIFCCLQYSLERHERYNDPTAESVNEGANTLGADI